MTNLCKSTNTYELDSKITGCSLYWREVKGLNFANVHLYVLMLLNRKLEY